jgi:hypothetical protein
MDHTQQNQSAQTSRGQNDGPRRFEEASIRRLYARIIRTDPLDDADWISWHSRMNHILMVCGLTGYVEGETLRPDPAIDSNGADNWACNDNYAKNLIKSNIGPSQMVHISQCTTAHEMWRSLVAVHDPKDHHTMISYFRCLFHTTANDGDDIVEHLTKLKLYWDRINLGDFGLKISEVDFKVIIANSLPPSWDDFIEPYIQRFIHDDPKKGIRSQELIGILRAEYDRREDRKRQMSLKAKSMVRTPILFTCKLVHTSKCTP